MEKDIRVCRKSLNKAIEMYYDGEERVDDICRVVGINKKTLYTYVTPNRGYNNQHRDYNWSLENLHKKDAASSYWTGFLLADGSVVNNSLVVDLQRRDEDHLRKMSSFFKSDYTIGNYTNNGGHKYSKISFNSKEKIEELKHYGLVPNKTNSVCIPNTVPEEYLYDFIRGYIDGDGSVGIKVQKRPNLHDARQLYFGVSSASLQIIEEIEEVLNTGNKITNYKTYYKLQCAGNIKAKKILDSIYKNSTKDTRLTRKYNTYKNFDRLCSNTQ